MVATDGRNHRPSGRACRHDGNQVVLRLPSLPLLLGGGRVQTMEKWLCWSALGVAGLLLVLFALDLFLNFPFGLNEVSKGVDIVVILACALLGYLGWNAYRDLR